MSQICAGFDCETTGTNLFHGDLPFMVCFTFNQPMPELAGSNQVTWEFPVDPVNRRVVYNLEDLTEIVWWLKRTDITWFLHNAQFDTRCIEKAIEALSQQICSQIDARGNDGADIVEAGEVLRFLESFDPEEFLNRCHDSHLMAHALDNRGSHGLKDLGIKWLNIGEDDREALQQQVEACRNFAESLGWAIASPQNCPFVTKKPNDGWWVMDMWLPAAIYEYLREKENLTDYEAALFTALSLPDGNFNNFCNVYCLTDTERTLWLALFLLEQLTNTSVATENIFGLIEKVSLYPGYELNRQQLPVAYHMSSHGLPLLADRLDSEQKRLREQAVRFDRGARNILNVLDLNLNSPEQVAQALSHEFNIDINRFTADGKLTVDKDEAEGFYRETQSTLEYISQNPDDYRNVLRSVLLQSGSITPDPSPQNAQLVESEFQRAIAHFAKLRDFLYCFMGFKKCNKAANSDLANYRHRMLAKRATNSAGETLNLILYYVLHTLYNIVGTDTTRYSSQDPNAQNIGKGKGIIIEAIKALGLSLRSIFGPRPGRKQYYLDGRQLQVVIAAYTSGVPKLRAAVERGEDLHEFTQKELAVVLGVPYDPEDEAQRGIAKNCNFGYLFGAGEDKTDTTAHMPGLFPKLVELFPEARDRIKKDIAFVRDHGYIMAGPYKLAPAPDKAYSATVYKIQGLEGVIMKTAMRTLWEGTRGTDYHLFINVHDEIGLDVPENDDPQFLPWAVSCIEQAGLKFGIPVKAEVKVVTTNWAEGKKVAL